MRWASLAGPVAVAYEAGPTGYGLARSFAAADRGVVVAAPSKIVRPAGDRVKTDAKDARLLARLLRMDELTGVRVPSIAEQQDLVRAREDARLDLVAARHRLSETVAAARGAPLRRRPCVDPAHERWLRASGSIGTARRQRSTTGFEDVIFHRCPPSPAGPADRNDGG